MKHERPDYYSYLLRLWRENDRANIVGHQRRCEKQYVWRASLEDSLTRKRQGFSSLDDLFAFLQQETGAVEDGLEKVNDA